jgi:hypothetical protein
MYGEPAACLAANRWMEAAASKAKVEVEEGRGVCGLRPACARGRRRGGGRGRCRRRQRRRRLGRGAS